MTETAIEASFKISWNIARTKRPNSEGQFIKQNIEELFTILDANNLKQRITENIK